MASKDLAANAAGSATSTSDLEKARIAAILATIGGAAVLDLAPLEKARFSNLPNGTAGGAANIAANILAAKFLDGSSAGDADADLTTILSTAIMEAEMGGQASLSLDMLIGHLLPNAEAFGFADSTYAKLITLVNMGDDPNSLPKSTGQAVVSDATAVMQRGLLSTIAGVAGTDTTRLGGQYGLPSANVAGVATPYASLVKGGTLLSQDLYMEVTGAPVFNGDADPGAEKFGTWTVPVTLRRGGTTGTRIPAGTALVNWGRNDPAAPIDAYTGGIILTSDLAHAPYIDIFTVDKHNVSGFKPWDDQSVKPRVRLGNLNGVAGNTTDKWGIVMSTDLSSAGNPLIQSSNEGLVVQDADVSIMNGSFYVGSQDGTSSYIQWDKDTQMLTIKNDLGSTTFNGNQITTGSITLDKIVFGADLGFTTEAGLYLNFNGPDSTPSEGSPYWNPNTVSGSVYSHTGEGPGTNQNVNFYKGKFGTACLKVSGNATNYNGGYDFGSSSAWTMVLGTRAYQGWTYDMYCTNYTFTPDAGTGQIAVCKVTPVTVPAGSYIYYGCEVGLYDQSGPYPVIGLATSNFMSGEDPDSLVAQKATYAYVDGSSQDVGHYERYGSTWYNNTGVSQSLYFWVWTYSSPNKLSIRNAEIRIGATPQYPQFSAGTGTVLEYYNGWVIGNRRGKSFDQEKGTIMFWVGLPIGGDSGSVLDPTKIYPFLGANEVHDPVIYLQNVNGEWRLIVDRNVSRVYDDYVSPNNYSVWDEYTLSGRSGRGYTYDDTQIEYYWTHVCVTYERYNQVCIYINGVLTNTISGYYDIINTAFTDCSGIFRLGWGWDDAQQQNWLSGYLDDFAILTYPLTAEQVAYIFNSNKPLNVVMSGDYKFSLMGGAGGGFIIASSDGIEGYNDAGVKQAAFSDSGAITDGTSSVIIDANGLRAGLKNGFPAQDYQVMGSASYWLKAGYVWTTTYLNLSNGVHYTSKIAGNPDVPYTQGVAVDMSVLSIENWDYNNILENITLDLSGNTYLARGARLDDAHANWIRTLAQNKANRFGLEADGGLAYYSQTDAGNTKNSTVTWGEKWSLEPNGDMHVYGNLTIDGTASQMVAGEGWVWGQWTNGTYWSGQAHSTQAKTLINLSQDFGIPAGVKEVMLYVAVKDTTSATVDDFVVLWNNNVANVGVFVDAAGLANGLYDREQVIVPCDANGNIYYQVSTTGSLSLWIVVLGYKLASSVPTSNLTSAGWSYLNTPFTNASWNGTTPYSTTAQTNINANTTFGVPVGAKAVYAKIFAYDTASAASVGNCRFVLTPSLTTGSSEELIVYLDGVRNSLAQTAQGVIPLDPNGNFAYKIQATGSGTMRCWIQVWGYLMGNDIGVASGWIYTEGIRSTYYYGRLTSSVASKTPINALTEFGLPTGTTAIMLRVALQDTASAANAGLNFAAYKTATSTDSVMVTRMQGAPNSAYSEEWGIVPLDANGNFYYTCAASGTNTMTVYLVCTGYLLPASIEKSNAATLEGYDPVYSAASVHIPITDSMGNIAPQDWFRLPSATYVSGTSFTAQGNWTSYISKGTKIRINQSGYKYFYLTGSSWNGTVTTFTVNGGTDYSVANAAIIEAYFSNVATPPGFPEWFNYTPTWTAASVAPAIGNGSLIGRFKMEGSLCTLLVRMASSTTTTFGSGNWSFAIPVPVDSATAFPYFGEARVRRPGSWNYLYVAQLANTDTVLQFFMPTHQGGVNVNNLNSTTPTTWTASLSDYLEVQIQYKF